MNRKAQFMVQKHINAVDNNQFLESSLVLKLIRIQSPIKSYFSLVFSYVSRTSDSENELPTSYKVLEILKYFSCTGTNDIYKPPVVPLIYLHRYISGKRNAFGEGKFCISQSDPAYTSFPFYQEIP